MNQLKLLFLAAILLVAGCGGGTTPPPTETPTTPPTTPVPPTDPTSPTDPTPPTTPTPPIPDDPAEPFLPLEPDTPYYGQWIVVFTTGSVSFTHSLNITNTPPAELQIQNGGYGLQTLCIDPAETCAEETDGSIAIGFGFIGDVNRGGQTLSTLALYTQYSDDFEGFVKIVTDTSLVSSTNAQGQQVLSAQGRWFNENDLIGSGSVVATYVGEPLILDPVADPAIPDNPLPSPTTPEPPTDPEPPTNPEPPTEPEPPTDPEPEPPTNPEPSEPGLQYWVRSDCGRVSTTYATAGGGTAQRDFGNGVVYQSNDFSSGDFVYISAQNQCRSGDVTVRIYKRGNIYRETSSSGAYVIATASGTY